MTAVAIAQSAGGDLNWPDAVAVIGVMIAAAIIVWALVR